MCPESNLFLTWAVCAGFPNLHACRVRSRQYWFERCMLMSILNRCKRLGTMLWLAWFKVFGSYNRHATCIHVKCNGTNLLSSLPKAALVMLPLPVVRLILSIIKRLWQLALSQLQICFDSSGRVFRSGAELLYTPLCERGDAMVYASAVCMKCKRELWCCVW